MMRRVALSFLLNVLTIGAAVAQSMPEGFSRLNEIDPGIRQDIRYAGTQNFTHKPVSGYEAAACILATSTAEALATAQRDVRDQGLTLLVYDCYRPARAVQAFVDWAEKAKGHDPEHNPRVAANRLIVEGYVGAHSRHSSGGTVDLTLAKLETGEALDMGTGFDFFDPLSRTNSSKISKEATANRKLLVELMRRHGFSNYAGEWWHYSFDDEAFRGEAFDFPVTAKQ